MNYNAPLWLPGGNLQTIWPALYSRRVHGPRPRYRRERWTTPDGDFIDVDWLLGEAHETLLVLFHGLEGSSQSHYAQAFADFCREHGLSYAVPHFRGCSGELNRGPRAYHSGDYEEVGWILSQFRQRHPGRIIAVGISLGGNALMRWAGEMGEAAAQVVSAVASVSSPLDLAASGHAIGRGFNRLVYTRMFLASMKPKALRKLAQHPGLFDAGALRAARDLYEFDDVFTAPLHGFSSADDYWARASAKPHLHRIRIPALAVNARNDPFVPASSLPQSARSGRASPLAAPPWGHVGFADGRLPGHVRALPDAVGDWLLHSAGRRMDDIVRQAMAKWPNVPDCYGWLGLDARGNWYLRDDRAQAARPFAAGNPASKGTLLRHDKLIEFIQRNYAADDKGRWFFQNGPQRVFVELEATPWIWRVFDDFSVRAHTDAAARLAQCLVDEAGRVYLSTDLGFGLVYTQDVAVVAEAVQAGVWLPQEVDSTALAQRFGYVTSPQRDSTQAAGA